MANPFKGMFKFWPHKGAEQAERTIEDYREVFGSERGKRVLVDILTQAGFYQITPSGGPLERNEGKREIANHIFNLVNISDAQAAQIHNLVRAESAAMEKERNSNG